ncbi:MAG TPA: ABC transporter ATP-binding protein [Planctomycetia bacterium]|nr:ABC transporter ATP-binding protein [Planctomycetia bacterium]
MQFALAARLDSVSVRYGAFTALDRVTLSFPKGGSGLVGRNGAGKSSLLRLLLGLVKPATGGGEVLGIPLSASGPALRGRVGYMPENDALVPGLSGLEQTVLAGELCGLAPPEAARRAHETLAFAGLGESRYRRVETFSAGMRQRLKLAVALVHDPDLLLLDEPTVGLDPPGRRKMLELVGELVSRLGKSVVVCTHLLSDIERVCDHVVMLEAGKVLWEGSIVSLERAGPRAFRLLYLGDDRPYRSALAAAGAEVSELSGGRETGEGLRLRAVVPASFDVRDFFRVADSQGGALCELRPEERQLADLYHDLLDPEAAAGALDRDG